MGPFKMNGCTFPTPSRIRERLMLLILLAAKHQSIHGKLICIVNPKRTSKKKRAIPACLVGKRDPSQILTQREDVLHRVLSDSLALRISERSVGGPTLHAYAWYA